MMFPTKYVSLSSSLLGIGATLLLHMHQPRTVTSLWNDVRVCPDIRTFDRFTIALDMLFLLGTITYKDGLLRRTRE